MAKTVTSGWSGGPEGGSREGMGTHPSPVGVMRSPSSWAMGEGTVQQGPGRCGDSMGSLCGLGPIIFPLWATSVSPSLKLGTSSIVFNFLLAVVFVMRYYINRPSQSSLDGAADGRGFFLSLLWSLRLA